MHVCTIKCCYVAKPNDKRKEGHLYIRSLYSMLWLKVFCISRDRINITSPASHGKCQTLQQAWRLAAYTTYTYNISYMLHTPHTFTVLPEVLPLTACSESLCIFSSVILDGFEHSWQQWLSRSANHSSMLWFLGALLSVATCNVMWYQFNVSTILIQNDSFSTNTLGISYVP